MQVNYHILPNSIVVNFDGKTISLNKGDHRFTNVRQAIKENRLSDIPGLLDNEKIFSDISGLQLQDGRLYFDGEVLPDSLSDRVITFQREGLPFEYLIKFFVKLRNNPSFNSRKMLYKFLEHNGHPITPEGNFIAYRGVTGDFKDRHTRKFDNSVGSVCEMPRLEVDDNPNNTCSSGLHVAAYDYAYNFADQTVEVEVDPCDVVCVPTDYDGTKMRVCKFKVVNVCKNIRNEEVYNIERGFNVGDSVELQGDRVTKDLDGDEIHFVKGETLDIIDIVTKNAIITQDAYGNELTVKSNEIVRLV